MKCSVHFLSFLPVLSKKKGISEPLFCSSGGERGSFYVKDLRRIRSFVVGSIPWLSVRRGEVKLYWQITSKRRGRAGFVF